MTPLPDERTRERLAEELGVSDSTIVRDAKLADAIDKGVWSKLDSAIFAMPVAGMTVDTKTDPPAPNQYRTKNLDYRLFLACGFASVNERNPAHNSDGPL